MGRQLLVACATVLATLLLGEVLCRLLPVSTATMSGYPIDADVMGYPPGHRFTVSTGWDLRNPQRLVANNWGFVSDIDFVSEPRAVALVGDSFVEASMLDDHSRPARQLHRALGAARPVYGLGSPGTALLDYAQRVRLAHQRLGVRDFVIWADAGDARQALCGSGNVHSRCLDPGTLEPRIERQPAPGAIKRVARHSALLQYVFGQLKVEPHELARTAFLRQVPAEARASAPAGAPRVEPLALQRALAVVDAVVAQFFVELSPYPDLRLIFVVDGRRSATLPPGELKDRERTRLLAQLRAHGATVVDLEPVYRNHLGRSRLSLEVGPYDAHLNALGVGLVMQQAAVALQAQAPR